MGRLIDKGFAQVEALRPRAHEAMVDARLELVISSKSTITSEWALANKIFLYMYWTVPHKSGGCQPANRSSIAASR